MANPRLHAVGPVVRQDLEVTLIGEGDGVVEGELRTGLGSGCGEGVPFKTLEHIHVLVRDVPQEIIDEWTGGELAVQ